MLKSLLLALPLLCLACDAPPSADPRVAALEQLKPLDLNPCDGVTRAIPEGKVVRLKGAGLPTFAEATSYRSVRGTIGCPENAYVHMIWFGTTGELERAVVPMGDVELVE